MLDLMASSENHPTAMSTFNPTTTELAATSYGMQLDASVTPTTFLSLPLAVRERIYALAGLVRLCPVNIDEESSRWSLMAAAYIRKEQYSRDRPPSKRRLRHWHTEECGRQRKLSWAEELKVFRQCRYLDIPVQVFATCKRISTEAMQFFYTKNVITMGSRLFNLSYQALALLSILQVRLTSCSCVAGHHCPDVKEYTKREPCSKCHHLCNRGNGEPLHLVRDRDTVKRWQDFCLALGEHCSDSLALTFICDCSDLETALEVTKCFNGFPKLKTVKIRLGQNPYSELGDLATQVVHWLTRIPQPTFPFLKLPLELQEMVFEHTDLVAPDYLSWHETVDMINSHPQDVAFASESRGFRLHLDSIQRCCYRCTSTREVCACPGRHGAYMSSQCSCWSFPRSIFLVSKAINSLAIRTFYSKNRFVLWETSRIPQPGDEWDLNDETIPKDEPCPKYFAEAMGILQDIPVRVAENIRWLKFLVPQVRYTYGQKDSPQYAIWSQLSTLIQKRFAANLEHLTIELDFAHFGTFEENFCWFPEGRDLEALQSFRNIAQLFVLDGGSRHYKDFFLRFALYARSSEDDWLRWNTERELERQIMGPNYDAAKRGKYRDRKSYYNESIRPKIFSYYASGWSCYDETLYLP